MSGKVRRTATLYKREREAPEVARLVDLLRERRCELGVSQQVLAERMGVTQARVCRWETGALLPGVEDLRAWARALGLRLRWRLDELGGQSRIE